MLKAEGLTKSFGASVAVKEVSVELRPGRIVGLVGANGAGKTTTIKMLVGVLEPTAGQAWLDGRSTLEPAARQDLGYLPEDSPLYDDMTPLAYLQFFGGLYELPRQEARRRAESLLSRLGLDLDAWKKPIGTLSKGMRRKVAIARCTLNDPRVLILDEPTSGLDPFTGAEVEAYLRELRAQGKAILLSAHNLKQVETLCDEILIMDRARIVTRGSLADLQRAVGGSKYVVRAAAPFPGSHPDGPRHIAVHDSWPAVEAALATIRAANGTVLEVESLVPTLAEILHQTARGPHG